MFWLHDKTRRALCRRAFLALALMPTLAVCAWIAWSCTDNARHSGERAIEQRLGLGATCSEISFPSPGHTVYHRLKLGNARGDHAFAYVDSARVNSSDRQIELSVTRAQVVGESLQQFWKSLVAVAARDSSPLLVTIGELKITGRSPLTLKRLEARCEVVAEKAQFSLRFEGVGGGPIAPGMLTVSWAAAADPRIKIELQSADVPIPCEHVAPFWPAIRRLGDDAVFRGAIAAEHSSAGWKARIAASRVDNVDLARLADGATPHHLEGSAFLVIDEASIEGGRVHVAQGQLNSGEGLVDRKLLTAAAKELGLKQAAVVATPDGAGEGSTPLRFDELSIAFRVEPAGIRLKGMCDGGRNGVMLRGTNQNPVAVIQVLEPADISSVLRILVPHHAPSIPASKQSANLASWLPLPVAAADVPEVADRTSTERISSNQN